MRVAVIDIGTYSTRLVIAEVDGEKFEILYEEGRITALGRGVKQTGKLSKEAIEETLKAVKRYKEICDRYGVERCLVVGTEALRVARNREKFLQGIERLGLELRIITPEEEGRYAYVGAFFAVKPKGKTCVIDQGGGSTEYIFGEGLNISSVISLPFGIVNLTERFIKSDPPTKEEIENLIKFLDSEISKVARPVDTLVGLGGTITTLAALEYDIYPYDPKRVNGKVLTKEAVKRWFEKLSSMTVEERKRIPHIEDRRAEAIIPGIAIFWRTLELFGKEELVVSDWSVKEGAIIANFALGGKKKA
jgi:exopolyphosphatase/guanosine-5'-triphosphate,3'-diphosphate pyrophosphatase